jgi:hypothetical protein
VEAVWVLSGCRGIARPLEIEGEVE